MKRFGAFVLAAAVVVGVAGASFAKAGSATMKIIEQAQTMTLEELAKKAIEESNGKMFYGLGNSSRGKSALPLFIKYLQTFEPGYTLNFEWQQPKNNKIFDQLTADAQKDKGTFSFWSARPAKTVTVNSKPVSVSAVSPNVYSVELKEAAIVRI